MHLYVYDCVNNWDVHVGYSGSRCCADNFGTAGYRNNGLSEHCHGTKRLKWHPSFCRQDSVRLWNSQPAQMEPMLGTIAPHSRLDNKMIHECTVYHQNFMRR